MFGTWICKNSPTLIYRESVLKFYNRQPYRRLQTVLNHFNLKNLPLHRILVTILYPILPGLYLNRYREEFELILKH